MRSLRAQLLLGVTLGTTAVLLASGALVYALVSRTLWAEFDEALAAKGRSLAAMADQDEEGVDFEVPEASLPEFTAVDGAEYYQAWRSDGTVFTRSPSLKESDLDRLAGPHNVITFRSVRLPNGMAGRIMGLVFVPRQEFLLGDEDSAEALTLVVGREVGGLQSTLGRIRGGLVVVSLVAVASAAGVLVWVVRRGLKPVQYLTMRIAGVGETALSTRIDGAGISVELMPVVDRLNELLGRLDAAFQRERRFTGDVAHELRTPLAGLRAKLELALSRDRSADGYRKTMDDCLRIDLQMQGMVENLLHLARADAGQFEVRRERVELPQLLRDTWQLFEARAPERTVSVEWRLHDCAAIESDRELLQLVVHNILDNAITYVNDRGRVVVSLRGAGAWIELTVENTGSTIPGEDIRHVFDRFWRGESTFRPGEATHCGLGLPLCKAVVEQLGGSIAASATVEDVFAITVRLPLRRPDGRIGVND
ncbi:MAG: hypothetical protein HOP29_10090 [Phycisphaerales bacterium]|nr:hypothetical protein [Phycisphaerales bacterium]